ncbi:MAG: pyruvate, water dikinase regulatory protein [Bacillota bacterium]
MRRGTHTDQRRVLYAVSDSTGETAERLARAALAHFAARTIDIRTRAMVDTPEVVDRVLAEADAGSSVIAYTFVSSDLRGYMRRRAQEAGVQAVDLMGHLMEALEWLLQERPKMLPGLRPLLDNDYLQRVEAVEFAVALDDGRDLGRLDKADVVLIGVSRSSKTPVSLYLAHRRLKVANVPLVPEVAPPPQLFRLPARRVIGLTVSPQKLHDIREERMRTLGLKGDANYARKERILEELAYADAIFRKLGCPVIDATNQAVEETAVRVLEIIDRGTRNGDD